MVFEKIHGQDHRQAVLSVNETPPSRLLSVRVHCKKGHIGTRLVNPKNYRPGASYDSQCLVIDENQEACTLPVILGKIIPHSSR